MRIRTEQRKPLLLQVTKGWPQYPWWPAEGSWGNRAGVREFLPSKEAIAVMSIPYQKLRVQLELRAGDKECICSQTPGQRNFKWLGGETMEALGTRDDQSGRAWGWGGRTQTIARNWAHQEQERLSLWNAVRWHLGVDGVRLLLELASPLFLTGPIVWQRTTERMACSDGCASGRGELRAGGKQKTGFWCI